MTSDLALARLIGTHATAAFALALLLLLAVVGVGWLALHRLYIHRRLPDAAAARALTATLALGFVAIVGAGLLFANLPGAVAAGGRVALADQALTDALRAHVSLPVLQLFAAFTVLGNTVTQWALGFIGAGLLAWRRERLLAAAWAIAFAGNGMLTRLLKAIFERVRPTREHELISAAGWSFPSGHSSGAVIICGMLAYLALRRTRPAWHLPIVLAATTVAFTVGCSRIFLQVHYASDVLAGFALGAAWLGVCVMAAEAIRSRRSSG